MKHWEQCVNFSINKTLQRMPEFEGDAEKSKELMDTLASLSKLQGVINEIRNNNNLAEESSFGQ